MAKRSYDQFCGLARALDLVGERWTLLLVRDLALGPQRYTDLLEGLPGIGSGLLAERLRQLEQAGIARKTVLPPPARVPVYELTDDGRDLAQAVLPLALWGARRLERIEPDHTYRVEWLLLSLWAQFKPDRAAGVHDVYELQIDGDAVHIRIDDGDMEVGRGHAPGRPDLVITIDPETLFQVGTGRLDASAAVAAGRASVDGPPEALRRCLEILGPIPAAAADGG